MDAKRWLEMMRHEIEKLEEPIQQKLDQKAELWSNSTRATPSRATAGSSALPRNSPTTLYGENVQKVEEALNAMTDRQEDLRLAISKAVSRIPDDDSRRLLYMRYARCMEWEDIAARLGLLPATVRWAEHQKALAEFEKAQHIEVSIDFGHDM